MGYWRGLGRKEGVGKEGGTRKRARMKREVFGWKREERRC